MGARPGPLGALYTLFLILAAAGAAETPFPASVDTHSPQTGNRHTSGMPAPPDEVFIQKILGSTTEENVVNPTHSPAVKPSTAHTEHPPLSHLHQLIILPPVTRGHRPPRRKGKKRHRSRPKVNRSGHKPWLHYAPFNTEEESDEKDLHGGKKSQKKGAGKRKGRGAATTPSSVTSPKVDEDSKSDPGNLPLVELNQLRSLHDTANLSKAETAGDAQSVVHAVAPEGVKLWLHARPISVNRDGDREGGWDGNRPSSTKTEERSNEIVTSSTQATETRKNNLEEEPGDSLSEIHAVAPAGVKLWLHAKPFNVGRERFRPGGWGGNRPSPTNSKEAKSETVTSSTNSDTEEAAGDSQSEIHAVAPEGVKLWLHARPFNVGREGSKEQRQSKKKPRLTGIEEANDGSSAGHPAPEDNKVTQNITRFRPKSRNGTRSPPPCQPFGLNPNNPAGSAALLADGPFHRLQQKVLEIMNDAIKKIMNEIKDARETCP